MILELFERWECGEFRCDFCFENDKEDFRLQVKMLAGSGK
jgi:hypothetical protein